MTFYFVELGFVLITIQPYDGHWTLNPCTLFSISQYISTIQTLKCIKTKPHSHIKFKYDFINQRHTWACYSCYSSTVWVQASLWYLINILFFLFSYSSMLNNVPWWQSTWISNPHKNGQSVWDHLMINAVWVLVS
jgi:hypothetical protein